MFHIPSFEKVSETTDINDISLKQEWNVNLSQKKFCFEESGTFTEM